MTDTSKPATNPELAPKPTDPNAQTAGPATAPTQPVDGAAQEQAGEDRAKGGGYT